MSTPKEKIINVFHSKFQSKTEIMPELEDQFLLNSIGEFSTNLYEINMLEDESGIVEDLKQAEINLLGMLMYKNYFHRERDKTLKLNNIVGKDIKLTAMANSKYAMNTAYDTLLKSIEVEMNKLKPMKFED